MLFALCLTGLAKSFKAFFSPFTVTLSSAPDCSFSAGFETAFDPKRDLNGVASGFSAVCSFCSVVTGLGAKGLPAGVCPDKFANGLLGFAGVVCSSPGFDNAEDAPNEDPNGWTAAGFAGVCSPSVDFGAKILLAAGFSFSASEGFGVADTPNIGLNGVSSAGFAAALSAAGFGANMLPNAGWLVCSFSASAGFDAAGAPNKDLKGVAAAGFPALSSDPVTFGEDKLLNEL
jgi:hypothetical protein